jgi:hypothetical protein
MFRVTRSSAFRSTLALVLVVAAAVTLTGCLTVNTTAPTEPTPAAAPAESTGGSAVKVSDRVAAPWGGGQYIGTVTAVKGDKADVLYDDDKVTREIPISELVLVTKRAWSVGEQVMAVWSSGKFYAGTITQAKPGDLYTVKWDDGSTPSDVEAAKIFKP